MNQHELEQMIREVIRDMGGTGAKAAASSQPAGELNVTAPDIGALNLQETLYVENPINRDAYMDMKKASPARLGVGRAGPRQHYKTMLRFRADHAAAMDAVFNDVSDGTIQELGLFKVKTSAPDKAEYLMNPAAGRVFDPENEKLLRENCKPNPQVQVLVSDGLSSTSVEANIRDILPSLIQGLKGHGLTMGTPVFIQYGRVGAMDAVADILGSQVTILLLGERPGLVTDESLSCYMTYNGRPGMAESARTVVSNIYKNGTPPTEAGAHIADIAKKMLASKASGLDLKL